MGKCLQKRGMRMEKEKNINEIWDVRTKRIMYFLTFFSVIVELNYFYVIVRPSDTLNGRDLVDYFQIVILLPFVLQLFLCYVIGRNSA